MNAKRVAIYARYSSTMQQDRSVDDQIATCRAYADREGLEVVATFADRAKSGASFIDRDGLLDLMRAAKEGKFDILLVESLDRLSRDQEDLAGLFKRLTYFKVAILTLNEGTATPVHIGLRGLVGQLFLTDLAQKVRRGQLGRVREGRVPGALSYGYRRIPGRPGEREIDPEQAEVVRRIFREYAAGLTPRQICQGLNQDGIPGPRGGSWQHGGFVKSKSADAHQGGLLRNEIYRGMIHWSRQQRVLNPETGKRVVRVSKPEDRLVVSAPHLRIVDDALWDAAQAMLEARSIKANGVGKHGRIASRNNSFLAGLVVCETCGGPMIVSENDRQTKGHRIKCRAAHRFGTCSHSKSYDLNRIEKLVAQAIGERLNNPALIASFVDKCLAHFAELECDAREEEASNRKRLSQIEGSILRLVNALEAGGMPEDKILPRLQALEAERTELKKRERMAAPSLNPSEIGLLLAEYFKAHVADLYSYLKEPDLPIERRLSLRHLVDSVVVIPTRKRMPYMIDLTFDPDIVFDLGPAPAPRSPEEIAAEVGVTVDVSILTKETHASRRP